MWHKSIYFNIFTLIYYNDFLIRSFLLLDKAWYTASPPPRLVIKSDILTDSPPRPILVSWDKWSKGGCNINIWDRLRIAGGGKTFFSPIRGKLRDFFSPDRGGSSIFLSTLFVTNLSCSTLFHCKYNDQLFKISQKTLKQEQKLLKHSAQVE